jgi:hypothetical protein
VNNPELKTIIGYVLEDHKYGGFMYNGAPFMVVADFPDCFCEHSEIEPTQIDFDQITKNISSGINLVLFENAYNNLIDICEEIGLIFPIFEVMTLVDPRFTKEIEICLNTIRFEYNGLEFVPLHYFVFSFTPYFIKQKQMMDFINISKN